MAADDPWFWTLEDVITEVCHSKALFQVAGCAAENVPNLTTLERLFRKQQMTGAAFLTSSVSQHAQEDFSIFNVGQRRALAAILELLRHRSVTYNQYTATGGVESLHLNTTSSSHLIGIPSEANSANKICQKRRKITPLPTTPLPTEASELPKFDVGILGRSVAQQPISGESQWDHLRRWENLDDDQEIDLADYDGLEDEEQYYGPGDAADEDLQDASDNDKDVEQHVQGRSTLTSDQIAEIINERIEYYTSLWKPNKKGKETHDDPEAMWEKAEAAGQRQQLVKQYEIDVAYYTQRLNTLCDGILWSPGPKPPNAELVRRQCRNLEVTIESLELTKWLLSIYSLEPVSGSEVELDISGHHNCSRESPNLPNHPTNVHDEVIDLGSPSEISSDDEGTVAAYNHSPEPTVILHEDGPNSVVVDTVESPLNTCMKLPLVKGMLSLASKNSHGGEPENASIATVKRWQWSDLVGTQDRKRIVSKAVDEMKAEDRELIRDRLRCVGRASMAKEIPACIEMLSKGEAKMRGVLPRDLPKIVTLTRLFLSWWLSDNYFQEEPSRWRLEELRKCLENGSPDPAIFCDYLHTIMSTTFDEEALRHPARPSQAEVIEISDDDDEVACGPSTQQRVIPITLQGMQRSSAIEID